MIDDYLELLDKKNLYDSYSRIINNPKDYKKINCKEILKEIKDYYTSSYKVLYDICTYQEIRLLKRIVNKEIEYDEIITDIHINDLRTKLFLIVEYSNKKAYVPSEFIDIIKEAYKHMDKEDLENKENLNVILIGLFRIYGILDFNSLYEILSNYLVLDKEVLKNHLDTNGCFKYFIDVINYKKKEYYIYRTYKEFSDLLFTGINSFKDLDYKLRSFEEIVYLRYNNFYDMNKKIGEFINIFSKLNVDLTELYNEIIVSIVLDDDRKDVIKCLKKITSDAEHLVIPLNNAMDNMPSAALKGYTRSEYLEEVADKKYDKEYDEIRYNNDIIKYKEIREKADMVINEAMYYAFKEKLSDKFNDVIKDNDIYFLENDTHIVENLLLFHKIKDEESIFDIFFNKKVNIFFPYYDLFKEYKDSYKEGLFKIIRVNKDGFIVIKDKDSNTEYKVYDIALSQNKSILNNYIYTSIVTINNYTFTTNYAFIMKDIKKKKEKYKDIDNKTTIDYLSYYELFRDLNIDLVNRNLE